MESNEDIEENIDEWVCANLPDDFEFRPNQKETIRTIISNIVNDTQESTIVEAPTGSGKSLICIISAGVLSDYYSRRSYILCSDLYLWEQYASFIHKNHLDFGCIKGIRGNYICNVNHQKDISLNSKCKLEGYSVNSFVAKGGQDCGFACSETCEYVLAKRQAMRSTVTLMTYQLWLNYMNLTDGKTFGERPVVFCDECHNIPNIVQMFCNFSINNTFDFKSLTNVIEYGYNYNLVFDNLTYRTNDNKNLDGRYVLKDCVDTIQMMKDMSTYFNKMYETPYTEPQTILDNYKKFKEIVDTCSMVGNAIIEALQKNIGKKMTSSQERHQNAAERAVEMSDQMSFYLTTLRMCGESEEEKLKYFVKNEDAGLDGYKHVSFACAKEDFLINQFLLSRAKYKVMLSATVGAFNAFNINIGIPLTRTQSSQMMRLPSTFDFTKSPIITVGKNERNMYDQNVQSLISKLAMTYKVIDTNLPFMISVITKILTSPRHSKERGLIHTGSYKNADKLYQGVPQEIKERMLIYRNAKEKDEIIDKYIHHDNYIIVGPTLTEGIDLPNDGCRFQIIMKVPFPNLGDKLVECKRRLFNGWYESETCNSIIQAVGRGNRNPEDYSTTYILDSAFHPLYLKNLGQFPKEFQNRIILLNNI